MSTPPDDEQRRRYMQALLADVHALERMLAEQRFETGVRRIGAEQEMFLVDAAMNPAPLADTVLAEARHPLLTNELALFNLEANATPRLSGGRCLSEMEAELVALVGLADGAARRHGAQVLLTGILPTLRMRHLGLANMTPKARYAEINRATCAARGGSFHVVIKGVDELDVTHDNVMLESCNTSFQLHLQVAPDEFARFYNAAQAVTGPVLAAATNSPVLLGKQLWHETRVALFQHSVDARTSLERTRNARPRVSFGDAWVKSSAAEVWRDNVARYRVLFVGDLTEDPERVLDAGGIPELTALRLHNGTVYRWNRVCYGSDGVVPHLRIENRVLPAGPSVRDEMATAALYYGLLAACVAEYDDLPARLRFEDAKTNFFSAARFGLSAPMTWVDGQAGTARALLQQRLLPMARAGLQAGGFDGSDIDLYLGIVEERVASAQTGSAWTLASLRNLAGHSTPDVRERTLTAVMLQQQHGGLPVHLWRLAGPADLEAVLGNRESFRTVGQFMSTDLFTVRPDDLVDLAANLMDWEHVRHVPVEDEQGRLVGLLSHRALLRLVARGESRPEPVAVREIMRPDPVRVTPETLTLDAIALMRRERVGCLPVVDGERLVGIITERDLIDVAARLLDEHLRRG